eukprot:59502-Rhodomonas_salina.4
MAYRLPAVIYRPIAYPHRLRDVASSFGVCATSRALAAAPHHYQPTSTAMACLSRLRTLRNERQAEPTLAAHLASGFSVLASDFQRGSSSAATRFRMPVLGPMRRASTAECIARLSCHQSPDIRLARERRRWFCRWGLKRWEMRLRGCGRWRLRGDGKVLGPDGREPSLAGNRLRVALR